MNYPTCKDCGHSHPPAPTVPADNEVYDAVLDDIFHMLNEGLLTIWTDVATRELKMKMTPLGRLLAGFLLS